MSLLSGTDAGPVESQVATAVVAVVVDLSTPAQVLQNAITWLQLVKGKLQTSYDWLDQRGSKLPEQLRLRARKYIGSTHEDKDATQHLGESWCKAKCYVSTALPHHANYSKEMQLINLQTAAVAVQHAAALHFALCISQWTTSHHL